MISTPTKVTEMSETEDAMPLSRRERRLREMAAAGLLPEHPPEATPEPPAAEPEIDDDDLEISPLNPDGSPRTRREMRQLRELLLAEREALALESTQAFTLSDLQEATANAEASADVPASDQSEQEVALDVVVADATTLDVEFKVAHDEAPTDSTAIDGAAVEGEPADAVHARSESEGQAAAKAEDPMATAPVSAKQSYSFPDITPLDEGGSVFDDPSVRGVVKTPNGSGGDFDDLISRAVAQEGAAGSTNASALILPETHPSDQLSGPIGETGELFITGELFSTDSIELPKSLGETGGHAGLLDSVQGDPDEFAIGEAAAAADVGGIQPVSAAQAVSARAPGESVIAAPEKAQSKMPIALIATGGGLLVVIAGLAIWAFASGFFA